MQFIIFLLFSSVCVHATSFKLQPIEEQLKEADGIIQGQFLKERSIVLDNGEVATQKIFKIKKEYGLQSDLYGMDEVIVHYPGGKVDGKHTHVEGVPSFVPGESMVLFIKSVENRYWGLNLGFGSFKLINYGNKSMLVNSLFPQHERVGQIEIGEFEAKVREIKGSNLKYVTTDESLNTEKLPIESAVAEVTASQGKNRSIASVSKAEENEEDRPNMNSFWLVSLLAMAGGSFRLMRQKSVK